MAPAAMFADANQILGYLSGYHETNVCVTRTLISFCVKVWRWRPLFGARVFFANLSINYSTATSSWPQPSLLNIAKGTTDPRIEFISQVQTKILIKLHLQNLDQASTSKSQPNISLSIKLKLQNLDQT